MATDADIIALADASPLISFDWPHRGIAPKGYIRGMAVAFARFLEVLHASDDGSAIKKAVARATADAIGDKTADVLAWYAPELEAAGASTATAEDKLVALFAIMLGLGMRESSGQHCVGADTPEDRGEPTTEANAEAVAEKGTVESQKVRSVRATDGDGKVQEYEENRPFTSGITGFHKVVVHVIS